jgi:hypothetical protein
MANQNEVGKVYSEDTIAVLLAANGISSISMAQYNMMSAFDGTKTGSSFQHQFRGTLRKAKELKARLDRGESFAPVTPSKKRSESDSSFSTVSCANLIASNDIDGNASPATPSKKAKATPKSAAAKPKTPKKKKDVETAPKVQDAQDVGNEDIFTAGDMQGGHNYFANGFEEDFIKTESEWQGGDNYM